SLLQRYTSFRIPIPLRLPLRTILAADSHFNFEPIHPVRVRPSSCLAITFHYRSNNPKRLFGLRICQTRKLYTWIFGRTKTSRNKQSTSGSSLPSIRQDV